MVKKKQLYEINFFPKFLSYQVPGFLTSDIRSLILKSESYCEIGIFSLWFSGIMFYYSSVNKRVMYKTEQVNEVLILGIFSSYHILGAITCNISVVSS